VSLVRAQLEPSLAGAKPGETFQFERHGYFIADPSGGFNRTVTLRDAWKK
jgi:glutaminyl-tRNA synthetase